MKVDNEGGTDKSGKSGQLLGDGESNLSHYAHTYNIVCIGVMCVLRVRNTHVHYTHCAHIQYCVCIVYNACVAY